MKKRFRNISGKKSKKNGTVLLLTAILLALSSSLVSCKSDEVKSVEVTESSVISDEAKKDDLQAANEVVDSTVNSPTTDDSENHDTNYYLNSNDSVLFQEAVFKFAKAYFSADQEEIKKYLADGVEPEVWEENIYDDLSRLVLKWNPEELATDKTMDVQYEFIIEGEDSSTYLGMVLEFQDEKWIVLEYYLEK